MKRNLKIISKLNKQLSDLLGVNMCLMKINEGCILLRYVIPASASGSVKFSLSHQQRRELSQIGVKKIYSDTEVYYERGM